MFSLFYFDFPLDVPHALKKEKHLSISYGGKHEEDFCSINRSFSCFVPICTGGSRGAMEQN